MKRQGVSAGLALFEPEIRAHFADGLSISESARILGVHWSSVRYQRLRLGLQKATDNNRSQPKEDPSILWLQSNHLEPTPLPEIGDYATSSSPAGILEVGVRACRWPLEQTMNAPGIKTLYCAEPAREKSSYCERHHRIAYRQKVERG